MLDPDQVAKAAAVFGSCLPDDDGGFANHFLARVYTRYGQAIWDVFRDAVPCLATKGGGCQAVEECVGISLEKTGEICPGTCSGSVHSECFDEVGLKFVWDCAAVGYACSPTRGCVAPGTGETCDASTFVEKCEAGRPLYCSVDEVRQGPACSAHALACDDAIGSCRGTGAACSGAGHSPGSVNFEQGLGCEGAALRACVAGAEALRECAGVAQGFSCQTQGAKSYCGLGAECLAGAHGAPTCEGDQLVVCNGGKATKVDCLALGFTGCDPTGICTPVPWL